MIKLEDINYDPIPDYFWVGYIESICKGIVKTTGYRSDNPENIKVEITIDIDLYRLIIDKLNYFKYSGINIKPKNLDCFFIGSKIKNLIPLHGKVDIKKNINIKDIKSSSEDIIVSSGRIHHPFLIKSWNKI